MRTLIAPARARGGLIVIVKQFGHDLWALAMFTFPANLIMVLVQGATNGLFFISPTDGWVEIIIESLAISLMSTVVLVIVTGAFFRWRKGKYYRTKAILHQ